MYRLCIQLFSASAFSLQQNRNIRMCYFFCHFNTMHRHFTAIYDIVKVISCAVHFFHSGIQICFSLIQFTNLFCEKSGIFQKCNRRDTTCYFSIFINRIHIHKILFSFFHTMNLFLNFTFLHSFRKFCTRADICQQFSSYFFQ